MERYLSIGEFFNTNNVIGGELKVFETDLECGFIVNGTLTKENTQIEIKGIAIHDTLDDKIPLSLLLFEYPLKKGANNVIYQLDGEFQIRYKKLDSKTYGKINTPKESMLAGKYFGEIFSNAIIEPLDEETLADDKDSAIKEFIFPEIDFDPDKGVPVTFTLEKNN